MALAQTIAHPAPFAARDVLKCTSDHAGGTDFPLKRGHLYRVSRISGGGSPLSPWRVHLHGQGERGFDVFRFTRIGTPADAAVREADDVSQRMAQVMLKREALTGACTFDDLARAGFTAAQVIEFADAARAIAGAPRCLEAA